MKKKYYSNGKKIVVIFLQGMLSIALVVSLFILGFLARDHIIDFRTSSEKKFENSQLFRERFERSIKEMEQLFLLKNIFEGENGYDSNKEISVSEYRILKGEQSSLPPQKQDVQTNRTELSYPISTLVDWAKKGYRVQDVACEIKLKEKNGVYEQEGAVWLGGRKLTSFHTTLQKISDLDIEVYNRGLEKLTNKAEEPLLKLDDPTMPVEPFLEQLNWKNYTVRSSGRILQELEQPESGHTIKELLMNRDLTITQAENESFQLQQVLDEIEEDASEYHRLHTIYERQDCNFYFWFYDKEQKTIQTNCTDISRRAVEEFGKKKGVFLYWNASQDRFKTNMKGIQSFFYKKGKELQDFAARGEVMFAVDTKYPYEDDFRETKEEYEKLCPWIMPAVCTVLISSMLWLVCMLFVTSAAGHTPETAIEEEKSGGEVIQLNWFDRIKTEFLMAGSIVSLACLVYLYIRLVTGDMWKIPGIFIMAGTLTTAGYVVCIMEYLSLVRRIKARSLWTGSLLYWFICLGKKALANRTMAVQLICVYGLHISLNVGLAWMAFSRKNKFFMIAFIIFLLAEGFLYMKEAMHRKYIMRGIERISEGDLDYKISADGFFTQNKKMANGINRIGEGLQNAVDESMKNERMKADLITNVSHDIKTPLTSIINYTNLIKMQSIEDETINRYVDILLDKSQRLKQLTEDLVEASKISSGNITLEMTQIDMVELIYQTAGEFNEKFEQKDLTAVTKLPKEAVMIEADGRRIWRVIENLYNNVAKYALEHTRVYVELKTEDDMAFFSIRNISQQEIKVKGEELVERFTRGDESRTTEGSGLGLSIARNLTVLMHGTMKITTDGDIFKAEICFPLLEKKQ